MATMGGNPHVAHVPVMIGGCGTESVRSFYETWFIGQWPEDVEDHARVAHSRRCRRSCPASGLRGAR